MDEKLLQLIEIEKVRNPELKKALEQYPFLIDFFEHIWKENSEIYEDKIKVIESEHYDETCAMEDYSDIVYSIKHKLPDEAYEDNVDVLKTFYENIKDILDDF